MSLMYSHNSWALGYRGEIVFEVNAKNECGLIHDVRLNVLLVKYDVAQ